MNFGETQVKFDSSLALNLGANQTWYVDGHLSVASIIGGSSGLALDGNYGGMVELRGANTYTGGTLLKQTDVLLGTNTAFGTGPVMISADGYPTIATLNGARRLANPFLIGGSFDFDGQNGRLTLTGPVTLTNSPSIGVLNNVLYIEGNIGESGGSNPFSISGSGLAVLKGTNNTYSGGTQVSGRLIFGSIASIPATGSISATGGSYVGLGSSPANPADLQNLFLARFDKTNTTDTIGFDTDPALTNPNVFSGSIDLTGFNVILRLGSATRAEISGTITPQAGAGGYRFGNSGGTLIVSSKLTGNNGVIADSGQNTPLMLRLTNSSNDYTGGTTAVNSAIMFAPGALSASTMLEVRQSGYMGSYDTTLTPATFIGKFTAALTQGIIGFDFDPVTATVNRPLGGVVDLSRFTSATSLYLGTATGLDFSGSIILPASQTDYRFAGYKGGVINISSTLTGTKGLVIGDANTPATAGDFARTSLTSAVGLTGTNSFVGDIKFYNGALRISSGASLGDAGNILQVIGPSTPDTPAVRLETMQSVTPITDLHAINLLSNLVVNPYHDLTLGGTITGEGLLTKVEQGGSHPLTLSGNNSSFDGGVEITSGSVIFANDFAAGTGILTFRAPNPGLPSATFTTSAPKIYGLQSDTSDATVTLSANSTLTINQYSDTVYRGAIAGTNAALVKNDSGSLRLEGASTYNGGTTINGGQIVAGNAAALGASTGVVTLNGAGATLAVDNGIALANPVAFGANGGVLAGNGTFAGAVTLGQGAGLAPGFSVGTLNFGSNLTLNSGSYFLFQVQNPNGPAGTGYDTINVTGQLNLAAATPFTINVISLASDGSNGSVTVNPTATYKWQLANASSITGFTPTAINVDFTNFSAVDGSGLTVVPPFVGNFSLSTSLDNTKLFLNFTPVPEPSTWALLLCGAGAVLFPALRRKRK